MTQSAPEKLGKLLLTRNQRVTVAESCTGGLICGAITDVAGSSAWFDRGFVVYSNQAKQDVLAVSSILLDEHGAVSAPVALAMARCACTTAGANWAVAVSGIAGPSGGSAEKPVGLVWFAWCWMAMELTENRIFAGDRASVRRQTVQYALNKLVTFIEEQA